MEDVKRPAALPIPPPLAPADEAKAADAARVTGTARVAEIAKAAEAARVADAAKAAEAAKAAAATQGAAAQALATARAAIAAGGAGTAAKATEAVTPAASGMAAAAAAAIAAASTAAAAVSGDTSRPAKLADAIRDNETKAAPSAEGRPDLTHLRSVKSEALRGEPMASSPRGSGAFDDLKRVRGVGVLIEKKLNSLGVTAYEQIANWTSADIDRISQLLDFKGRIERENWVEQARILASGGQTEFSRRVDRGEVETSR